jgi:dimethylamine monooxygenase subunit A
MALALPTVKRYYPFHPGPFRMAMNLFPLDLAEWIEIDTDLPAHLAEKHRLLTKRPGEVFAALLQALAGSQETLDLLVDHLTTHFPQIYARDAETITNHATGERWQLADSPLHPLDLAGRLVQEDLCLMQRDPEHGVYCLVAASLCFPTRWRLHAKLGQALALIHGPTPHYAETMATPMDRAFDKLRADRPVWRLNWSVLDNGALFQPTGHGRKDYAMNVTAENAGDKLWLRVERQTLRRLPQSGAILFTIRIYSYPFYTLSDQPAVAQRLAAAIAGLDDRMTDYKSLRPIRNAAIAWLESR